jgi:hypothetical protein
VIFYRLLFYTLAAFGLSYIFGRAQISLNARIWFAGRGGLFGWFVDLVECPACFGTWLGFGAGFLWPDLVPLGSPPFMLALYSCACGYLLGRLTGWLRERSIQ